MQQDFISEQQAAIVKSQARHKLINGCAGSHKTSTLIKAAIEYLQTVGKPVQFLTLVGSVTFEIKTRLEAALNIAISRFGQSNHYVGYYNNIPICISNYDAFVHHMLTKTDTDLMEIGDIYSEKIATLLGLSAAGPLECITRTNQPIGLLLIDEAQDLCPEKMAIVVNLAKNNNINVTIAGDYLQTIFISNTYSTATHAMNIFKELQPTYFDLNTCYRCPAAHIRFNNALMSVAQIKYSLPSMKAAPENRNMEDKPFIFTHHKTSANGPARIVAEQVCKMIKTLMETDETIVPADIAIIMARSQNNMVFIQLADILKDLYKSKGYVNDSIALFSTDGDGYHRTIDWDTAENKTVMLSIHGDKGKGHKVVFFLGLTEGGIPREQLINTPSEILAESLLNVATTRSTKYLFIGFTYNYPSRYLQRIHSQLDALAYCSWKSDMHMPFTYKEIQRAINETEQFKSQPVFCIRYNNDQLLIGDKQILQVRNDISKDFDQAKQLVMNSWSTKKRQHTFGIKQQLTMPLEEEHCAIIGIMSEILIQRSIDKEKICDFLTSNLNERKAFFTDNEPLLSFMYDLKNKTTDLDAYLKEYASYFSQHTALRSRLLELNRTGQNAVHCIFNTDAFRENIAEFTSDVTNEELASKTLWNIALFYNHITQQVYRPAVYAFINYFHENIDNLHVNVAQFINTYIKNCDLIFERPVGIVATITDHAKLKLMNCDERQIRNGLRVGISGRYDMVDQCHNILYELKASRMTSCPQEWLIQTVCYALLMKMRHTSIEKLRIVNVLHGITYEWDITQLELPSLVSVIETKIGPKYKWHPIIVNSMCERIMQVSSQTVVQP